MNITLNLPSGPVTLPIEDLSYVDADTIGLPDADDSLVGEDLLKTLDAPFILGTFSGIVQKQAPLLAALASADTNDTRVAMLAWADNLNMTGLTGDQHDVTRAFGDALITITTDLSGHGETVAAGDGVTVTDSFKSYVNWKAYLDTKSDLLIRELPSGRYAIINANA